MDQGARPGGADDAAEHEAHRARHPEGVPPQLSERVVLPAGDVHRHAVEQRGGIRDRDPALTGDGLEARGLETGRSRTVVERAQLATQLLEDAGALRGRRAVDRVVAAATPRVDGRDLVPPFPREEATGEREALRVLGEDPAAVADVGGHARRSASTVAAVALAELSTPGTPGPGCVPAPTR